MGEDPGAADAGGRKGHGLRTGGGSPGPAHGRAGEVEREHARGAGPILLSESALEAWGVRIGAAAITPLFLALRGELGAGKSVLARAIARGAGVEGHIPSPTFNLVFRYDAAERRAVVHMDLYRLQRAEEVRELGWSELPGEDEIVLVEWPERAEALLPPDRWEIRLATPEDAPELRELTVAAVGAPPALPPLEGA